MNTFGNQKGKSVILKHYSFSISNSKNDFHLYLSGFAVPVICIPLVGYDFEVIESKFPAFKNLEFSDTNMNNDEIGILIGMDYYWTIVSNEMRHCNTEGLVAVNSKLGWLLSGLLSNNDVKSNFGQISNLTTHSMFISLMKLDWITLLMHKLKSFGT